MKKIILTVLISCIASLALGGAVQAGSAHKVTGSIWNPFAAVKIADRLQVTKRATFKKDVRFYGNLFNPKGYVTIDDDAVVTGSLDVRGNVSDSVDVLTLDDATTITGDLTADSNVEIKGEIYNSNTVVTVNDDMAVTGNFSVNSVETPTDAGCDLDGTITYDTDYLYLCVSNNWKKASLSAL